MYHSQEDKICRGIDSTIDSDSLHHINASRSEREGFPVIRYRYAGKNDAQQLRNEEAGDEDRTSYQYAPISNHGEHAVLSGYYGKFDQYYGRFVEDLKGEEVFKEDGPPVERQCGDMLAVPLPDADQLRYVIPP